MRVRIEILDTEPYAKNGTYIWESGETEEQNAGKIADDIAVFLLRSLAQMHALKVIR